MSIEQLSIGCAVAGALVALTACGGSSGSSAKSTTTGSSGTRTSTLTASPSPTVTPVTVAQLRKIVLQPTDLPGWKASPPDDSSDSPDSEEADLMACVGAKSTVADQIANVESDNFDLGDAELSASATSYKSQSDLNNDVAVLKSPKFLPCATQQFKQDLATAAPAGGKVGTVSVRFTPGPGTGPANVAGSGRATVPLTVNGQQAMIYIDFVYLTGPLIEAEVDAENIGAPIPAAVLQSAVKAVATRAANGG
jgi:hypothetical protein